MNNKSKNVFFLFLFTILYNMLFFVLYNVCLNILIGPTYIYLFIVTFLNIITIPICFLLLGKHIKNLTNEHVKMYTALSIVLGLIMICLSIAFSDMKYELDILKNSIFSSFSIHYIFLQAGISDFDELSNALEIFENAYFSSFFLSLILIIETFAKRIFIKSGANINKKGETKEKDIISTADCSDK